MIYLRMWKCEVEGLWWNEPAKFIGTIKEKENINGLVYYLYQEVIYNEGKYRTEFGYNTIWYKTLRAAKMQFVNGKKTSKRIWIEQTEH